MRRFLALDLKFPMSYAIFLLELARNEGAGISDLHSLTGIPVSTLSRIAGALGDKRQNNARGYGLIRQGRDGKNLRHKPLYLTPEGRKLVRAVTGLLAEDHTNGEG
jgi:DNA-binding MarR family transcriptional regulator